MTFDEHEFKLKKGDEKRHVGARSPDSTGDTEDVRQPDVDGHERRRDERGAKHREERRR